MTIDLPFTTYSIERTKLGIIVVSFDVLIVISFFISFYILGGFERQEEKDINKHLLTTEDFAIVVKTLPSHHDYNSLKELKALLWNHLEQVIADEPQVHHHLQKQNDNNSQIVNIHFGMTQFGRMKMLLNIYNDMKEQLRQEKRQSCDKTDDGKYD